MQIHTLLVSVNRLDNLTDSAVIALERNVGLLDVGDAVVVRMADDSEQLLVVVEARFQAWIATCTLNGKVERLRLEDVDGRRLRVAFEGSDRVPSAATV